MDVFIAQPMASASFTATTFAVGGNEEPNYCPNCGSRMDLDGDTE